MPQVSRRVIDDFLAHKRLAVVGVSRDRRHFSRSVVRALRERGYEVVPVNPQTGEIDGLPCVPRVQAIAPPVEGALIMTPAGRSEEVVRDCIAAHVPRVWLHRASGAGAVSERAVALCRESGIGVVPGACPLMFLPATGLPHRIHGWVQRLTGTYPR